MKSIFASKTFWFNLLTLVVTVAAVFGYTPDETVAQSASAFLIALNPGINLVLRYFTNTSVYLK
jgi:hypothetical protein